MSEKIKAIVGDNSLSAQKNIGFLFSERKTLYPFPVNVDKSDFIVLYLQSSYQKIDANPFSAIYSGDFDKHYEAVLSLLNQHQEWHILFWKNDFLVLGRNQGNLDSERYNIINHINNLIERKAREKLL